MAVDREVLARVDGLSFTYPDEPRAAIEDISLEIREGERLAMLGPSGGGKSTILRALSGLVPHFHGGSFSGRVDVVGHDTRVARPAQIAGAVATVFQDPEDQIVMTRVANEVAFGLENLGVEPGEIWPRVASSLRSVGIEHLSGLRTTEISGGELQRVCLAAALALGPRLLLLDEPTSQLDPEAAASFLELVGELDAAVVISEHRIERTLRFANRAVFVEDSRILLDAPVEEALNWLSAHRPRYVPRSPLLTGVGVRARPLPRLNARASRADDSAEICQVTDVKFAYGEDAPVLSAASLTVHTGEVVVLEGTNGSGKTTLAKIAAGLLEPQEGSVRRLGRAGYLSQDPGRYLVKEHVVDEAAVGVGGDRRRAKAVLERVDLGALADRHPRDLSSGERERLGLAAVAVSEPTLLVLDEPTRGVDPDRKAALAEWLFAFAAEGRGVLIATHDVEFPADRRLTLAHGQVATADGVGLTDPDSQVVWDDVFAC